MIINGKSRSRGRQLAAHLLRQDQNESIRLYETRGTVASELEAALLEMEAHGAAARCQRPLYHASISPEAHTPLTDAQIGIAVDTLEQALGLNGQARAVVIHRKGTREHVHAVWSRIDADQKRAIPDSWNYRHHEQAARALEALFGHRPILSSQTARSTKGTRMERVTEDYEWRQQERSGRSASAVATELTRLWNTTASPEEFLSSLGAAGYRLARGDRRVFVVVDSRGEAHSLARRIAGADTSDIRMRLGHIDLGKLPSVAEVRAAIRIPAKHPLTAKFSAVASELTRHVQGRAIAKPGAAPPAFREAAIFATALCSRPSTPRQPLTTTSHPRPSSFRRTRAYLIAHYAAKIADARKRYRPDQLEAVIGALIAEREAAIEGLKLREGGGTVRRRRDRTRRTSALRRKRRWRRYRLRTKG
jgi:hypothetical protein